MGPQYRSIVLYHSPEQKQIAEKMVAELERQRIWPDPIVTQIEPLEAFYPAEAEHQGYYRRNPNQGYCGVVIAPRVAKLRSQYLEKLAG